MNEWEWGECGNVREKVKKKKNEEWKYEGD